MASKYVATWRDSGGEAALLAAQNRGTQAASQQITQGISDIGSAFTDYGKTIKTRDTDAAINLLNAAKTREEADAVLGQIGSSKANVDAKVFSDALKSKKNQFDIADNQAFLKEKFDYTKEHDVTTDLLAKEAAARQGEILKLSQNADARAAEKAAREAKESEMTRQARRGLYGVGSPVATQPLTPDVQAPALSGNTVTQPAPITVSPDGTVTDIPTTPGEQALQSVAQQVPVSRELNDFEVAFQNVNKKIANIPNVEYLSLNEVEKIRAKELRKETGTSASTSEEYVKIKREQGVNDFRRMVAKAKPKTAQELDQYIATAMSDNKNITIADLSKAAPGVFANHGISRIESSQEFKDAINTGYDGIQTARDLLNIGTTPESITTATSTINSIEETLKSLPKAMRDSLYASGYHPTVINDIETKLTSSGSILGGLTKAYATLKARAATASTDERKAVSTKAKAIEENYKKFVTANNPTALHKHLVDKYPKDEYTDEIEEVKTFTDRLVREAKNYFIDEEYIIAAVKDNVRITDGWLMENVQSKEKFDLIERAIALKTMDIKDGLHGATKVARDSLKKKIAAKKEELRKTYTESTPFLDPQENAKEPKKLDLVGRFKRVYGSGN